MMTRILKSLFFFCILSAATVSAQSVDPPMMYQFPYLCPGCSEDMEISIRVSSNGTSILETQTISTTPVIDPEYDDSVWVPGHLISGPLTKGLTGRIQDWETEIGTIFIEVNDDILPETGVRYLNEDLDKVTAESDESSWSLDNFSVDVKSTGRQETVEGFSATVYEAKIQFIKTDYSPDGGVSSQNEVNYQFQLWLSEEMPFTPLPFQYEPFKENHIPPYNLSPINDLVVSSIIKKIDGKGGLVKSMLLFEDHEWTAEIKNARSTPPVPMHKFENLPVISSSQVDNFAGPLFIVSMLRDDELSDTGSGIIRIDDQELPARSSWKVNEAGDLVIVVTAENQNTTFFLIRPLNGKPGEGTFDVKNQPESSVLRSMNDDELAAHSDYFQVYGLVSDNTFPAVISGFQSGRVVIESAENETIRGRASGDVNILRTDQLSENVTIPFEVLFTSESGLGSFQFKSPESRVAGR